jgi:hypothetical protein
VSLNELASRNAPFSPKGIENDYELLGKVNWYDRMNGELPIQENTIQENDWEMFSLHQANDGIEVKLASLGIQPVAPGKVSELIRVNAAFLQRNLFNQ